MNILLVYPETPNTFWSYKNVLKFCRKTAYPPLGLLTVSSLLPKEWSKKLIDMNIRKLKDQDIEWADLIFISAMVVQENGAIEVIKKCKFFNKKIVMGGPVPTTQHEKFEGVDHFVLDEAEVTLPLFLSDLEKGEAKHIYTSQERPDLTKTPLPDWSLINLRNYLTMGIQYSRGCPFNCDFCYITIMNGRVPRTKSPTQMIDEFQALYDRGHRGFLFIVDDNFIGNKVHVKEMLKEVIEWQKKHKYPFRLLTEASIDLAKDEELMNLMSKANFYKVFLGIESTNLNSLKECSKVQNTDIDLVNAIKIIHEHGMMVMGGFIVGFDNDGEGVFESQLKFIQKVGIVSAMVGLLNAPPKTRLWNRLKSEGRILGNPSGENTDGTLNFIPKMDKDKLIEGYRNIMKSLYTPKNYYKRINTFIKSYHPTVKLNFSFKDSFLLFWSVLRVGTFSNKRFLYWKTMLKLFFTKRKAIPLFVELAVGGLHFEKFAKCI